MLTKGTGLARYSRAACWVVALIWLLLAVVSFTSNAMISGSLWLAGALAFAISAIVQGRRAVADLPADDEADTGAT